jgi:GDP-mannose 4,6 dehydratase
VVGTSRDAQVAHFANLDRLSITDHVELESMALTDFRSTLQTITKAKPDEVYNLAGLSSVALSFQQPVETMDSISVVRSICWRRCAFSAQKFGSTTQAQANVSAISKLKLLRNKHPFIHAVPMRLLKRQHIGRWSTIAMPTACLPPMGSYSTMNLRCGRSALSRKRLFAPPAAFRAGRQKAV